jgi:hypothetical protein
MVYSTLPDRAVRLDCVCAGRCRARPDRVDRACVAGRGVRLRDDPSARDLGTRAPVHRSRIPAAEHVAPERRGDLRVGMPSIQSIRREPGRLADARRVRRLRADRRDHDRPQRARAARVLPKQPVGRSDRDRDPWIVAHRSRGHRPAPQCAPSGGCRADRVHHPRRLHRLGVHRDLSRPQVRNRQAVK